jgi:hypothetical protein
VLGVTEHNVTYAAPKSGTNSYGQISAGTNVWKSSLSTQLRFAEYIEPPSFTDGYIDTGNVPRAYLPIKSATEHDVMREYTGPANVINTRVVCIAPKLDSRLSGLVLRAQQPRASSQRTTLIPESNSVSENLSTSPVLLLCHGYQILSYHTGLCHCVLWSSEGHFGYSNYSTERCLVIKTAGDGWGAAHYRAFPVRNVTS